MNEDQVKKILEIESEAQSLYEQALKRARQLPLTAMAEAKALVENAREQAMKEAADVVRVAREEAASVSVHQSNALEIERKDSLARLHFDQAVYYVLDQVLGKKQDK
ncbi:MAG: hypothetical protein HPY85_06405 [Anaerolineae bacterium]|nr:hypothetical protein [Anaerolineae bacterium]